MIVVVLALDEFVLGAGLTIPIIAEQFCWMRGADGVLAATEVIDRAVLVAAPADTLWVSGVCRIAWHLRGPARAVASHVPPKASSVWGCVAEFGSTGLGEIGLGEVGLRAADASRWIRILSGNVRCPL